MNNFNVKPQELCYKDELKSFSFPDKEPTFPRKAGTSKTERLDTLICNNVCTKNIYASAEVVLKAYENNNYKKLSSDVQLPIVGCIDLYGENYKRIKNVVETLFLGEWRKQRQEKIKDHTYKKESFFRETFNTLVSYLLDINKFVGKKCIYHQSCIKQTVKIHVGNYLSVFENNLMLCDPKNPNLKLAFDKRVLRSFFNEYLIKYFFSDCEDVKEEDYDDLIRLTLNCYFDKESAFEKFVLPIRPIFIAASKLLMIDYLLSNDEYRDKLKPKEIKKIFSQYELDNVPVLRENLKSNLYELNPVYHLTGPVKLSKLQYVKLIKALYLMTDGNIEKVKDLAKLMARIYLGSDLCEILGIENKKIALINIANSHFAKQFFTGLFSFAYNDMKTGYQSVQKKSQYAHNSVEESDFVNYWKYWNQHNIYRFQQLPYRAYGDKKSYFHISKHRMEDFIKPINVGKFIEDKYYGNIANISVEKIINNEVLSKFKKVIDSGVLENDDSLLGNQKTQLNCKFVFITDEDNSYNNLIEGDIDFEYIRLSDSISKDICVYQETKYWVTDNYQISPVMEDSAVYRDALAFTQYEKYFMSTDFLLYGLSLLVNDADTPVSKEVDEDLKSGENYILNYFIEQCCEMPDYSSEKYCSVGGTYWKLSTKKKLEKKEPKPEATKVISLDDFVCTTTLFTEMYKYFHQLIKGTESTLDIDLNKSISNIIYDRGKVPKVAYRWMVDNFSEVKSKENSVVTRIIGIKLKPQSNIAKEAEFLKAKLQEEAPISMDIEKFADFIFNDIASDQLRLALAKKSNRN